MLQYYTFQTITTQNCSLTKKYFLKMFPLKWFRENRTGNVTNVSFLNDGSRKIISKAGKKNGWRSTVYLPRLLENISTEMSGRLFTFTPQHIHTDVSFCTWANIKIPFNLFSIINNYYFGNTWSNFKNFWACCTFIIL